MAKGQVKKAKTNKPKLSAKEKKAKKGSKTGSQSGKIGESTRGVTTPINA